MKTLIESIISHTNNNSHYDWKHDAWGEKELYDDPNDIVEMLLSGRYIISINQGNHLIKFKLSRNTYKRSGGIIANVDPCPIDPEAFDEAINILEKNHNKVMNKKLSDNMFMWYIN